MSELLNGLAEDPDPPLVVSTLILSVVTGSILGNSLTDKARTDSQEEEEEEEDKNCPQGYEVVYVQDGNVYVVRGRSFLLPGKKVKDGYYCRPEGGQDNTDSGGDGNAIWVWRPVHRLLFTRC